MSVSFPKPLSEKEERYYIQAYEDGDEEAKSILIERNLRLVAHIAKKYTSQFHTMDDFISIGTIGLIKAVNTFSSSRSTRLATYAARCIENEILMSIRASRKNSSEVSLNIPIGTDKDGNEISLNDILGTEQDAIIDDLDTRLQIRLMLDALNEALTDREKKVIIHRYGIMGAAPLTQREVAAHLGISRSYVSRIEKRALEKMRDIMAPVDTT
ncbi:MAG: RNA polymerase sporulation sigma factor SigK [Anaerovoracaceae bacterium]|nr:RNA polymerase sporulation sigma factor SigK [Anaerovoracaceae bacterium]